MKTPKRKLKTSEHCNKVSKLTEFEDPERTPMIDHGAKKSSNRSVMVD